MNRTMSDELRSLFPVWWRAALLPLPLLVLFRSGDGLTLALGLFFVGAASVAAYSLPREEIATGDRAAGGPNPSRRTRSFAVPIALLADWIVFSSVCLALYGATECLSVVIALCALVPSYCIAPYLTQLTRKPFAAVVFTAFLVGCMKLLGCVVVVVVHGWDASERGYTTMPWAQPNLLVWLFWVNTVTLSLVCYFLSSRRLRFP
jgi:hypothetical protein